MPEYFCWRRELVRGIIMDIYYFWLPVLFAWSNLTSQKSEASCLSQWQVILYNFLFEGKRVVCASLIAVTRLSAKILFFVFFFILMLFLLLLMSGPEKPGWERGWAGQRISKWALPSLHWLGGNKWASEYDGNQIPKAFQWERMWSKTHGTWSKMNLLILPVIY